MPASTPPPADGQDSFRLAFAPGVTPGKWVRVWTQRLPDVPFDLLPCGTAAGLSAVRSREADAALVRLPIDREDLHAIPLYTETTVVVLPKDHVLTLLETVTPDDLADEVVHLPLDDVLDWTASSGVPGTPASERPASTRDAVDLVLAGVGLVVLPQSLARLHHHKELVYRPVGAPGDSDRPVATSQIALVWREDHTTDLMEEFIGIVRGRTPNSSRGIAARGSRDSPRADGTSTGKSAGKTTRPGGVAKKPSAQNKPGPQKKRSGPQGRPGRGRPDGGRRR